MRSSWLKKSKKSAHKKKNEIVQWIISRYETQLIKIKTEICLLEQAIGAKKRKLEQVIIIIIIIIIDDAHAHEMMVMMMMMIIVG